MIREKQQERIRKAVGSGQMSSGTGLNQEQSLQRAGDTRWGSHYKTLKSLCNLFPEVIDVLQYVEKEGPNDAERRQARGLIDYLKDFDFVFHFAFDVAYFRTCRCFIIVIAKGKINALFGCACAGWAGASQR